MSQKNGNPKKFRIHYTKTDSYRVYHVDGFFGGITPNGKLHIEPYIDKIPTPKSMDFAVTKDNQLGNELSRDTLEGSMREIEAGLIFDISVAETLIAWLRQKVDEFNKKASKK